MVIRRFSQILKNFSEVVRDEKGRPILPILAKGANVIKLGRVIYDRPNFHSKAYIWPVGFSAVRRLPSIKNGANYTNYTCTIVDGGQAPIFQVIFIIQFYNFSHETLCETKNKEMNINRLLRRMMSHL